MIIRQAKSPRPNRDLAQCPPAAALTTVTRGGYPQTSVVWCDFDGQCLRVNTMRGFAKEQNMRRNPRGSRSCATTRAGPFAASRSAAWSPR
jgi:Pyridoxamine 5'-phosphate oxidase